MTATGVLLLLLCASWVLVQVSTVLILARHGFPLRQWRFQPRRLGGEISGVVLAGWGIATAVGILRLRRWTRFSGLLVCSYCAYIGFGFSLSALAILPYTWQRYGTQITVTWIGTALLYFGLGGLGALGAVFLNSESAEREFRGARPVSESPRPAAVTCIGIWLIAAWPLVLALGLVDLHPLVAPPVPFAWVLSGWKATAFQYVVACTGLALGVGLLRMRPRARTGVLGLCGAAVVSALTFPMRPSVTAVGAVVARMAISRPGVLLLSLWDASPAVVAAWLLLKRGARHGVAEHQP